MSRKWNLDTSQTYISWGWGGEGIRCFVNKTLEKKSVPFFLGNVKKIYFFFYQHHGQGACVT